jgi:hypothetical protein
MDSSSSIIEMKSYSVIRNLAIISCIVVAEFLTSTSLLLFIYFMVKGFGYEESQVGARAGLISTEFLPAAAWLESISSIFFLLGIGTC